ncbi:heterokaryon incompatibility protein-domain-containing protein [Amylocarpus encephaloides]|uniref:Heterokaryon incompatibility protein-domain-containing protein n=1 Tax=Amylocarpus encephaloides TaxID=45428 RepID=A0A9P8BY96_9HELO|nr:heterokaryon incompatibility protein-domain-containing protein [Amylocarpus encephaloides]
MAAESDSFADPSWTSFSVENDSFIRTSQHCPERPYISVAIISSQNLSVRRIDFTTISHDQGFSDKADQNGDTYADSYTWFDARVITHSGHDRVPRRRIQTNVRASFEFKTHINRWDWRQGDAGVREWLAAIQTGDTVQVIPMAHFPAWNNFVRGAKIQLWAAPATAGKALPPVISLVEQNDYSAYRPLRHDLREIRLVEVQPDENAGPIRIVLRYTSLSDEHRLRYDALSYCWGDAEDLQQVLLTAPDHSQPRATFVNRNLLSALQQLRSQTAPRTLWIDLLCINQTDMKERTSQVALMGEIFASAETVCVWLGDSDPDGHRDCQVIRSISDQYDQTLGGLGVEGRVGDPKDWTALPKPHLTHEIIRNGPDDWDIDLQIDRVFQRPWFQRVWVLQEVWNAVRVQVFYGSDEVQWQAILQANHCLKKRGILNRNVLSWLWNALFTITRDETGLNCDRTPRSDILTVLIAAHNMKATDPRDKIFAMLVFGNETYQTGALPEEVRPNYEKSVVLVYADFTRWWILHHRSLRILSAVHTLTGRSWVNTSSPHGSHNSFDLSQRPSWMLWHEGFSEWMNGTLALHDQCGYRASGCRVIDYELLRSLALTQPNNLALRGVRLSAIASLAPYPFYQDPPLSPHMRDAFLRLFDPNGSIGTWNSFRIRRSVGEVINMADHSKKSGEWKVHYDSHWDALPPRDGAEGLPTWLPCLENCMFTTIDGGVGLCPTGSRVGDLVVVLYGGMVPYLLRPKICIGVETDRENVCSGEFYFVGECYLKGSMYGEACSSISDSNTEVFLLA